MGFSFRSRACGGTGRRRAGMYMKSARASPVERPLSVVLKRGSMDEECVSGADQSVFNSISEQRSVLLVCEGHGDQILSVLRTFREKGMLFDFHIHVQDEILPCHRCVLAACSDFFR
ncbi:hypothetical protein AMELA_G00097980 [Ameiurus melas]|uniref:BTB domain-containing protein n=1 Tax=Ameiurus melas TaxID=219545 RepID=A0A7J6AVS0_AMEME|nr:hypothetical protein AMELA_G00097980 [Ameiurus melas]